jgi:hypothetical protein
MRILMSYFSRTGCTEKLAMTITDDLRARGHELAFEIIRPARHYFWLREMARDWPRYPSIGCTLLSAWWREHHIRTYHQVEEDIEPLQFPDVSEFDRICVGGPKWAQISYPVARYLRTLRGIQGKKVGSFATFGGAPLKTFEIALIKKSMERLVKRLGAETVAHVYVTSGYHEIGLMPFFRLLSLLRFGKPVDHFTLGTEYANRGIENFCNDLLTEKGSSSS